MRSLGLMSVVRVRSSPKPLLRRRRRFPSRCPVTQNIQTITYSDEIRAGSLASRVGGAAVPVSGRRSATAACRTAISAERGRSNLKVGGQARPFRFRCDGCFLPRRYDGYRRWMVGTEGIARRAGGGRRSCRHRRRRRRHPSPGNPRSAPNRGGHRAGDVRTAHHAVTGDRGHLLPGDAGAEGGQLGHHGARAAPGRTQDPCTRESTDGRQARGLPPVRWPVTMQSL